MMRSILVASDDDAIVVAETQAGVCAAAHPIIDAMRAGAFDELEFFRRIQISGVRALLIGRRAMVVLGLPVLTADYDYWIDIDGIAAFNDAVRPFDLAPTKSPEDAKMTNTSTCSSPVR